MLSSLKSVVFLLVFFTVAITHAQTAESKPFVAPVPPQIASASKVFIGNAGTDLLMMNLLETVYGVNEHNHPYDLFYQAMKSWGRYELVSNPDDADLVVEIAFVAQVTRDKVWNMRTEQPQFRASIFDAKTHFVLWTLTHTVQRAYVSSTWKKNLQAGVDGLIMQWKEIATAQLPDNSPSHP